MLTCTARRFAGLLVAPLALGALAAGQNPRTPEVLESFGLDFGFAIDTVGDLTALLTTDYTTQELMLRTSDGRGLDWSSPIRIDSGAGLTDYLAADSLAIVGDRVYVAYSDLSLGSEEIFLRSFDTSTGTLSPQVRVPNGFPAGEVSSYDWDMEAEAGPGGDRVYFVIALDLTNPNIENAYFVASHDGGATFPIARTMSSSDIDAAYELEASGGAVHVAWSDNRFSSIGNDVFYQRSTDGGVTFLPADVQLDASGPGVGDATGIGFHLLAASPIVAVGWAEQVDGSIAQEIFGAVSTDDGVTFAPSQRVDQAPGGQVGLLNVAVTADPDTGNVAVGWDDTRFGGLGDTVLFAATTTDGGLTWNEAQLTTEGILGVIPERGSTHEADGRPWLSFGYAGYYTDEVLSASSLDGGLNWEPPVLVAQTGIAGFPAIGRFATNALYGNRIHAWSAGQLFGSRDLVVGGYRVPTLDFVVDDATPSYRFELSEHGSASFGAVLLSGATGTLPVGFGDPRDLGLAADALLAFSSTQVFGVLGASLTAGAGATPAIPGVLPPGLGIHAAAVSFDLAGGVSVAEITDVQVLP